MIAVVVVKVGAVVVVVRIGSSDIAVDNEAPVSITPAPLLLLLAVVVVVVVAVVLLDPNIPCPSSCRLPFLPTPSLPFTPPTPTTSSWTNPGGRGGKM